VSWNSDPALLAGLVLLGVALLSVARLGRQEVRWPVAGWAVLSLALVSPLCSMSVALFSMRVTQHLVITLAAAPLLAIALMRLRAVAAAGVAAPVAAFAASLWGWHVPAAYDATFRPDGIAYWLMHATLAGSATWFWAALFRLAEMRPLAAATGGMVTAIQMGVLGALLTLAPRPLYAVHPAQVTLPWGLTPLEDQQLGGLLMWVPGGLLFLAVLAVGAALALRLPWREAARGATPVAVLATAAVLAAATMAPQRASAQGNDSASTSSAPSEGRSSAAPVGVLTTSSVTTGNSGPKAPSAPAPEGADRRTRVLGAVCEGVVPPVLMECRAKSGM
jgi:putative membrane protein